MTTSRPLKSALANDSPSVAESPRAPVLAAQYVRMSTDQQQYSLDNQALAIREYAEKHNM